MRLRTLLCLSVLWACGVSAADAQEAQPAPVAGALPELVLEVTREQVILHMASAEDQAQVRFVHVHIKVGPESELKAQQWVRRAALPAGKGQWRLPLGQTLSVDPNADVVLAAALYGEAQLVDGAGATRRVRSPEQVWELGPRPRLGDIESVIPEFAPIVKQGQGPVAPKLARALLKHVEVGQRYLYAIRTGRHESTLVQKIVSVKGGKVVFAQKFMNGHRVVMNWREQSWQVPGTIMKRYPPKRTDRTRIPGLGELECLVWTLGDTEVWVASVDNQPTFPWLVKIESPQSVARLVRVDPEFR